MLLNRRFSRNKGIYFLAKSDRINTLRKQYDAFLEEDKKRKERNEYILGKLDKMRISTALTPLPYKPTLDARPSAFNFVGYPTEAPSVSIIDRFPISNQSQLFQDIQLKNSEDTYLIQEISKKYILIPKLRSPLINHCIQNVNPDENIKTIQGIHSVQKISIKDSNPDITENTDWKSKYEILNLLKNEEKQAGSTQTGYAYVSKSNVNGESLAKNNCEQVVICGNNIKTDVRIETSKKDINELPEKDFTEDTLHYGLKTHDEHNFKDVALASLTLDTNITYTENNESWTKNDDHTDTTNNKLQDAKLEYKYSNKPNTDLLEDVSSNNETQPKYNAHMLSLNADCKQNMDTHTEIGIVDNEYPDEVNFSMYNENDSIGQHRFANSEQVVYRDENEANLTEDIHSDELMKQLNHNLSLDINTHITENEHSTEASLAQDFRANKNVQMKADPKVNPEEQTDLPNNPTQQIEPDIKRIEPDINKSETVIEQMEYPIENMSESIEDFNAEQNDMFYSEQTDENRQSDAFNLDYSQNVYQQDESYNYYEGTQSEAQPINLYDQEETLRYDPIYEQQYSDSDQGSVKQQMEQQPQQYRQPVGNQPQPDLELLRIEQPCENEKEIEEALDIEDGYIAQQHVTEAVEKRGVVENVEVVKHDNMAEMRNSEEMMG